MNLHQEIKKEFQIERLLFFSDAVFAIAITLLVIEIKPPHIHQGDNGYRIVNGFLELIPKFIGFIVSFFVIGIYWISHHRMCKYLKNYDTGLLWLNLFFLFSIVLMPFTSAYYSENFQYNFPFVVYCVNVTFTGVMNFFLLNYISNPKRDIAEHMEDKRFLTYYRYRTLVPPLVFFLAIFVTIYVHLIVGRMFMMSIPLFMWLINKRYNYTAKKISAN